MPFDALCMTSIVLASFDVRNWLKSWRDRIDSSTLIGRSLHHWCSCNASYMLLAQPRSFHFASGSTLLCLAIRLSRTIVCESTSQSLASSFRPSQLDARVLLWCHSFHFGSIPMLLGFIMAIPLGTDFSFLLRFFCHNIVTGRNFAAFRTVN